MALTIQITKVSASESMSGLWNPTINLKIFNNEVAVLNQDFSVKYRKGEDINIKQQKFLGLVQAAIDKYKGEQQIFNHAKMDDLVTFLNNNLVI